MASFGQAASWMGRKRDNAGHSIMFELIRSIPDDLVERQSQAKVAGAKRKLGT